jgi:hypothetical protein
MAEGATQEQALGKCYGMFEQYSGSAKKRAKPKKK